MDIRRILNWTIANIKVVIAIMVVIILMLFFSAGFIGTMKMLDPFDLWDLLKISLIFAIPVSIGLAIYTLIHFDDIYECRLTWLYDPSRIGYSFHVFKRSIEAVLVLFFLLYALFP